MKLGPPITGHLPTKYFFGVGFVLHHAFEANVGTIFAIGPKLVFLAAVLTLAIWLGINEENVAVYRSAH
jgi:hypothetical protein